MIKKVFLTAVYVMIFLFGRPFSVSAAGNPITDFDYTNYYELEYINGSGTQYINTGLVSSNVYGADIKFRISSSSGFLFGVGQLAGSRFNLNLSSNTFYSNSNSIVLNISSNTDYVFTYQSPDVYLNSSSIGSVAKSDNVSLTVYLMARQYSNSPDPMNGKIYYAKFYDSKGDLLGYFVPAERKVDGVYGFFNTVNGVFYTNSGSGSFSAGNRISYDPVVNQYTITTSVSPSGSGSVSGGGTYDDQTVISLVATANSGYQFSSWSDGNTSNPRSVTVTQNETYTAIFEEVLSPIQQYTITTSVSPSGSGSVSGGGTYDENTVISLTAAANSGYQFVSWSDNNTSNPRSITVSQNATYTAIFEEQTIDPDPTPPSGWTDWDDSNDYEYLDDITENIDLSKIYWNISVKKIIDHIQIYTTQLDVQSSFNGSNINRVLFTGSYYDNTITALQGCNSSAYTIDTDSHTLDTMVYVQPAVYGSLDMNYGQPGEDLVFNFGLDIESGLSGNETFTTTHMENRTEACRLIGMNSGDGSIDGSILLAAGYQKKTLSYNDGSLNGHTATFYVPGDEEFSFAADLSFLDDLLENLYINFVNNGKIVWHREWDISIHGSDGYLMPEFGSAVSKTFIGNLLQWVDFPNLDKKYNYSTLDNTYIKYNYEFDNRLTNNTYGYNYCNFYWQGTRNPHWYIIESMTTSDFAVNNFSFQELYGNGNYSRNEYLGLSYDLGNTYTISSSVATSTGLTQGALMYVGFDSVKFYQLKNNSLINRFNQLGQFLYTQLTRIYNAIGNISGGNESNEIINNVVNDYDIDVENNFNGLLTNVENKKQQIDLTLPEYNVPSSDLEGIQALAGPFKQFYQEVYIDNGLGIIVLIPVLLLVLRLIL